MGNVPYDHMSAIRCFESGYPLGQKARLLKTGLICATSCTFYEWSGNLKVLANKKTPAESTGV